MLVSTWMTSTQTMQMKEIRKPRKPEDTLVQVYLQIKCLLFEYEKSWLMEHLRANGTSESLARMPLWFSFAGCARKLRRIWTEEHHVTLTWTHHSCSRRTCFRWWRITRLGPSQDVVFTTRVYVKTIQFSSILVDFLYFISFTNPFRESKGNAMISRHNNCPSPVLESPNETYLLISFDFWTVVAIKRSLVT